MAKRQSEVSVESIKAPRVEITVADMPRFIRGAIRSGVTPCFLGQPGLGKTEVFKQTFQGAEVEVLVWHPALWDALEFGGMLVVEGGEAKRKLLPPMSQFLRDKPWRAEKDIVVFVDEIDKCPKAIQNSLLSLLDSSRQIHGYHVPENASFVLAGNRQCDMANSQELVSTLVSRVSMVPVKFDKDALIGYARRKEWSVEAILFAKMCPQHLEAPEPDDAKKMDLWRRRIRAGEPLCTPRTLENADKMWRLGGFKGGDGWSAVASCIGPGEAFEFVRLAEIVEKMPDPEDCVRHPSTTKVPKDADICFALGVALERLASAENLEALTTYLYRMESEYMSMVMWEIGRRAIGTNRSLTVHPAYVKWVQASGAKMMLE